MPKSRPSAGPAESFPNKIRNLAEPENIGHRWGDPLVQITQTSICIPLSNL